MLKHLIFATSLAASPAAAQEISLTDMLAQTGLAATEAALTTDDAATQFALGGVRFLRAIESTLQLRYRHDATFDGMLDLPVLRLPLPSNPNAEPFYPGLVADLFRGLIDDMAAARTALEQAKGDFGVTLDLSAIWFDVNENGQRDPGERLSDSLNVAMGLRLESDISDLVVRFDTADAAWLRAYTHLLSGFGNLVLAFDPTEVVQEIGDSVSKMQDLRGDGAPRSLFFSRDDERIVDLIAIIYGAINRQPDATYTRQARDQWLAMVAANRDFWSLVAQESDDVSEWIPNATQTAALGFQLPPETGTNWMAVLTDAEAVLKGDLLVSHWRTSPGAGVNVAKLMENPVPVDIITWTQGHGLIDVTERGPLVSADSFTRFAQMFGGGALLFMVLLN